MLAAWRKRCTGKGGLKVIPLLWCRYEQTVSGTKPPGGFVQRSYYPLYFPSTTRGMSDIITAKYVIFGLGMGGALFLSFIYIQLMRFEKLALCTIWTCVAMVLILVTTFITLCVRMYFR